MRKQAIGNTHLPTLGAVAGGFLSLHIRTADFFFLQVVYSSGVTVKSLHCAVYEMIIMKELPDDYFLDADDELVNFLEKQGENCIGEIQQSNVLNKENGQKLLNILIVGVGSSFLLLTQRPHLDFLGAGIAVFAAHWSFCSIYLVLRVLSVRQRLLAVSTPYALYHEEYKGFDGEDYEFFKTKGFTGNHSTLNILRRYRLADLTRIAEQGKTENTRIGGELERVRIAAILTPLCALIISALTYFFF